MRPQAHRALALFLLSVGLAGAQAPAGFRTFVAEGTGLEFFAPTEYSQIPLPPTESTLAARFQRKSVPDELESAKIKMKPELVVYCFPIRARNVTGKPSSESAPADEGPKTLREAMEKRSEVVDFEDFKAKRLGGWSTTDVPGKPGHFILQSAAQKTAEGYLVHREEHGQACGIYGVVPKVYSTQLRATITGMARGLKLPDRAAKDTDASADSTLDRLYKDSKLTAIAHRKTVRKGLATGWKALDTPHYIIVQHSPDEKLVNKIARDIEAMQGFYSQLFPPVKPVEAVSVVRVCRNRTEFLAYGGPPMSGGFWHAGNEELVFYDFEQTTLDNEAAGVTAGKTTDKDSLLVLYHEAFHQYIYYAVGEVAPHDWFNEGHGDYFSGAVIPQYGTKVDHIGPSPWRIHRAKDQCEFGKGWVPLKALVHAERAEYYNPARQADYYAAGWSFVYFLREAEVVKKHPRWSKVLTDYFDALKRGYLDAIEPIPKPTLADKQAAQAKAKEAALAAFLKDVDLDALESQWKSFIVKMKDPWPERRKKP